MEADALLPDLLRKPPPEEEVSGPGARAGPRDFPGAAAFPPKPGLKVDVLSIDAAPVLPPITPDEEEWDPAVAGAGAEAVAAGLRPARLVLVTSGASESWPLLPAKADSGAEAAPAGARALGNRACEGAWLPSGPTGPLL